MQTAARSLIASVVLLVLPLSSSCRRPQPPAPGQTLEAAALPKITVRPRAKMLFTYATAGGTFTTTDQLNQVPEVRRSWVRVIDLAVKPERRLDHELVYVADLRQAGKDGNYPYIVMPREAFEAAALGRARAGAEAGHQPAVSADQPTASANGRPAVILYATSWCSACRAARSYMQAKGIPFVEKDIERDPAAATELLEKARAAGISASGVPVLDIGGTLMQGFDAQRLDTLLGGRK